MSHFLLIGGGIGQLNLARLIKARGDKLTVMAFHFLPEIEKMADQTVQQDLFDLPGALIAAAEIEPDAVVSDQHDLYIPTVAFIAEHLGLPGNKYEQVMTYCDKNRFRNTCDLVGVPVPKHFAVSSPDISLEECGLSLPVMVKPADSQSSVGVVKIDEESGIKDALANAISLSRSSTAIIEEFFVGHEVVCEGLIQDGTYYNLDFADRVYFDLPDKFIPSQTVFPSTIPDDVKHRIEDYENRLACFVKPRFAIVHSEYLWNQESDEIRCVESALRGGGVFISSHLIPACTGIGINDLLLDFASGNSLKVQSIIQQKQKKAAAYICFYLPQGVVERIVGFDEVAERSDVIMACIDNIRVGRIAEKMEHKGSRLGPILVQADSRHELEESIRSIQEEFKVFVRTPDGLKTQIW